MLKEIFNTTDHFLWHKFLPLDYFVNPASRVFWLWLLSSAVIALVVVKLFSKDHKIFSLERQKKYWFSKSALLDYKYFFVIWFLKLYLLSPLIFSAKFIAIKIFFFLSYFFPPLFLGWKKTYVSFLYTFTLFLFSDFTRYWLHRWLHNNKILWQFHKVHHSAESLNPFTFYRTHPVENFLFGMRYAFTAGLVTGIFFWLFGTNLSLIAIFGSNIFIAFFSFFGANLRHSPIKLSYPLWLEKIFISPAQHQLHHSTYGSRKNFGGYLSVWDNMFGSLLHTKHAPSDSPLGIIENKKLVHYYSIKQLLWQPFINIFVAPKFNFAFFKLNFKKNEQGENQNEKKYREYVSPNF